MCNVMAMPEPIIICLDVVRIHWDALARICSHPYNVSVAILATAGNDFVFADQPRCEIFSHFNLYCTEYGQITSRRSVDPLSHFIWQIEPVHLAANPMSLQEQVTIWMQTGHLAYCHSHRYSPG